MIVYSCKYVCFPNKNREKSNTLTFLKLINFLQQIQYNAPNLIYVFQNFPVVKSLGPLLVLRPRTGPFPPKSWLRVWASRLNAGLRYMILDPKHKTRRTVYSYNYKFLYTLSRGPWANLTLQHKARHQFSF